MPQIKEHLETKKKKKLVNRLLDRYRLTILNESTFEEQYSTRLSPMFVIAALIMIFVVSSFLIYILVAYTPLKEYLIPEYNNEQYREDAMYSRAAVDSLTQLAKTQDLYIFGLQKVLSGDIQEFDLSDTVKFREELLEKYVISVEDSLLRLRIEEESKFELKEQKTVNNTLHNLYLFKPISGTISSEFDPKNDHFGIDIIAPISSVVNAVLDGTVIHSSYSPEDGNIIQIQHDHNLISVYKHNSKIFKRIGDFVKAGESIAIIGNTGSHSDGPHLHLELWLKGVPTDPGNYFSFSE